LQKQKQEKSEGKMLYHCNLMRFLQAECMKESYLCAHLAISVHI